MVGALWGARGGEALGTLHLLPSISMNLKLLEKINRPIDRSPDGAWTAPRARRPPQRRRVSGANHGLEAEPNVPLQDRPGPSGRGRKADRPARPSRTPHTRWLSVIRAGVTCTSPCVCRAHEFLFLSMCLR